LEANHVSIYRCFQDRGSHETSDCASMAVECRTPFIYMVAYSAALFPSVFAGQIAGEAVEGGFHSLSCIF